MLGFAARTRARNVEVVGPVSIPSMGTFPPDQGCDQWKGLPWASTPSTVPVPSGAQVMVSLWGGGSEPNWDWATFSFQVPVKGVTCFLISGSPDGEMTAEQRGE